MNNSDPRSNILKYAEIMGDNSQEHARRIPASCESCLSINQKPHSLVALMAQPRCKADDKDLPSPGSLILEEGQYLVKPSSASQLITRLETRPSELSFHLRSHVIQTSSISFLYLLFRGLPHSLKTEGWLSCRGNLLPPPLLFSQQFFYILIKSVFIVCKASFPSTATLQERFPV